MKKILLTLPLAILAVTLAQPGRTQSAAAGSNEYQRNQNTPPPKVGTSEGRSAERKAKRAETKAAAKAGEIPEVGEDWGKQPAEKPQGTHESRSAERKAKRAETKQAVKSGTLPVTNEADVAKVPTTSR